MKPHLVVLHRVHREPRRGLVTAPQQRQGRPITSHHPSVSRAISLALTTLLFFGVSAASASVPESAPATDAPVATTPAPVAASVTVSERLPGPSLRLRSAPHSLLAARERGLRVKVDVAGAVRLQGYAILDASAAERTLSGTALAGRAGDVTMARAAITNVPSGQVVLGLKFGPSAQEALTRFLQVTFTVRLVAIDALGNRRAVERLITLS